MTSAVLGTLAGCTLIAWVVWPASRRWGALVADVLLAAWMVLA